MVRQFWEPFIVLCSLYSQRETEEKELLWEISLRIWVLLYKISTVCILKHYNASVKIALKYVEHDHTFYNRLGCFEIAYVGSQNTQNKVKHYNIFV